MIANPDIQVVRQIVLDGLRNHAAKVYLFGSQAKGVARKTSDIDVAIWPEQSLPAGLLSDIRQDLENSDILFNVDLVDLSNVDDDFRQKVIKEGILWSD